MSVPAIIRLAPILRLEDLDELRRRGRDVYDTRTFRPLLRKDPFPVVVDHGEREIGHVREFAYREAPESGTWCFAHCRLDEQPGWLGPGAPCSFGSALRRSIDLGGIERVVDQRILEITVCSPSFRAVEPLARVEWIGERTKDSPAAVDTSSSAGENLLSPGVLFGGGTSAKCSGSDEDKGDLQGCF